MRWTRFVLLVATIGALGLLARLAAPAALALSLAAPPVERVLARLGTEPEVTTVILRGETTALEADLYQPQAPTGALLLVHGLSRAGRRQPDLVRLARALARQGQAILVPDFDGLRRFRLGGREIDEIRHALGHLRARWPRVGVAGFSFGAGPALIAAADCPDLGLVGSFGGYADLRNVVAYVTTGFHEYEGRQHRRAPEEFNRWKLLALLAAFAGDEDERARLHAVAERRLADPSGSTAAEEARLGPEGQQILALVRNRRPDAVEPLIAALPIPARAAFARLSPVSLMARLPGRLVVAHGAADLSIPFTESLRLAAASQGRTRAVVFQTFDHTGPRSAADALLGGTADLARLVGLADRLRAWPRGG